MDFNAGMNCAAKMVLICHRQTKNSLQHSSAMKKRSRNQLKQMEKLKWKEFKLDMNWIQSEASLLTSGFV